MFGDKRAFPDTIWAWHIMLRKLNIYYTICIYIYHTRNFKKCLSPYYVRVLSSMQYYNGVCSFLHIKFSPAHILTSSVRKKSTVSWLYISLHFMDFNFRISIYEFRFWIPWFLWLFSENFIYFFHKTLFIFFVLLYSEEVFFPPPEILFRYRLIRLTSNFALRCWFFLSSIFFPFKMIN